jgi:transposase
MIPVPSGVRVWLAVGRTDMRRRMNGLALQVQEALGRDPHAGDLHVFRGVRGRATTVCYLQQAERSQLDASLSLLVARVARTEGTVSSA